MNLGHLTRRQALHHLGLGAIAASSPRLGAQASRTLPFDGATIADVNAAFDAGVLTSEALVRTCLARIETYDRRGPELRAVLTRNPRVLEHARALDAERKTKGRRSPLHGVPVLLKDNIDTADLPTTAGSIALEGSVPSDDAFIVRRLREAGAVILGKANLSEFASGLAFSSLGGQMRNPHDPTRTPLGSSGGSGIAVAAAYCWVAIGSDTGGSIRNPASTTGVVGLKPTLGLVSRDGIVPLALSFDTAGPLGRSVYDVAATLSVIAGVDRADLITRAAEGRVERDYTAFLKADAFAGARLGLARDFMGQDAEVDWIVEAGIAAMRRAGATVVDVRLPAWLLRAKGEFYDVIRSSEFPAQIADYLRTLGPAYPKTMEALLERLARTTAPGEDGRAPNPNRWGMMRRESTYPPLDDPRYLAVRDHALPLVRATVDGAMTSERLDALVYPTLPTRPPLLTAPPNPPGGPAGNPVNLANLTGFPDLVVPAGMTTNVLPVTMSFLGPAFSEPRLLALGHAFEQLTQARRLPRHTPLISGDEIPRA